jgi:hypothetical protein
MAEKYVSELDAVEGIHGQLSPSQGLRESKGAPQSKPAFSSSAGSPMGAQQHMQLQQHVQLQMQQAAMTTPQLVGSPTRQNAPPMTPQMVAQMQNLYAQQDYEVERSAQEAKERKASAAHKEHRTQTKRHNTHICRILVAVVFIAALCTICVGLVAYVGATKTTSVAILDGTVATSDIANGAVTTGKIQDKSITSDDIMDFSITSEKLNIKNGLNMNGTVHVAGSGRLLPRGRTGTRVWWHPVAG